MTKESSARPTRPTRRDALRGLVAGAGGLALGTSSLSCGGGDGDPPRSNTSKSPNVLVILVDQMRASDMGCAGNAEVMTPNIDRLAGQGMIFDRAFANIPLCAPARAQLWTGRYPLGNRVLTNFMALPPQVPTIAQSFTREGWRCGYIGKWHLGGWPEQKYVPPELRGGFDDLWVHWKNPHAYFDGSYYRDTETLIDASGYGPDVQTRLAIDYVNGCLRDGVGKPFFLALSYGPPHMPFDEVPERFSRRYDGGQLTLPPSFRPNEQLGQDEAFARKNLALYYAACTALDEAVGRLLDFLDEKGLAQNTIVVFLSDHGGLMGEHGLYHKQQPFEESIRIPFMMRWPGKIPAGQRAETLFSMVDVVPTLCSLAGVPIHRSVQGADLSWSAYGGVGDAVGSVYLQELVGLGGHNDYDTYTWRGVRTERWLYAEDMGGPWLMHDLAADPYQLDNVVGSEAFAGERSGLVDALHGWYQRLEETYRTPREHLDEVGRTESLMRLINSGLAVEPDLHTNVKARDFLAAGGTWKNPRY